MNDASPIAPATPPPLSGPTRRVPRLLIALALSLAAGRIAAALHEREHPIEYPTLVAWRTPAAGAAEAARDERLLVYEFTASWCGPCQVMNREVFGHRERARAFERQGVPVRIDEADASPEAKALRQRFQVNAYPMLVAVSADGSFERRRVGGSGPSGVLVFVRDAAATWAARRRTPPADRQGS